MKKYLFLGVLAAASVAGVSVSNAQTTYCPYGYTCTPIQQYQVPVSCPFGYTCTPIGGSNYYPTYPTYPTYPSNPSVSSYCYVFNTQLSIGSYGTDVANLQSFLISRGFSIGYISSGIAQRGYFGVQTAAALSMYQQSVGLSPTGMLDAATRAQINSVCGTSGGGTGGTNAGPLRITSPNGGESWQTGSVHSITWTSPYYFAAAYADLRLLRYQAPCVYGNVCPMYAFAPYTIASGIPINQNSYSWTVGNVLPSVLTNSSYQIAPDGQYTVQICQTGTNNCDSSDSSLTIYSSGNPGNPGQAPVISGIDAPTTLAVGQVGTWTVHASDPQNGILSYSVDWGDQAAVYPYNSSVSSSGVFTQTTTFTHSYSTTGTFTVTFTVRDSFNLTAQSKVTVAVGATANNQPLTVTSPNGGEIWKIGSQQTITWTGFANTSPYYNYYNNTAGTVRITLNYQCPGGVYCTAVYHPPYIIQNSAPNSGSSAWTAGSVTIDGATGTTAPAGTYVVTVCRYDNYSQPTACDQSDNFFTLSN